MNHREKIMEHMVELLELPDSAYEKAISRYEDLGEWLGRDESICCDNDVHVFAQGSFRLGTAIRPLADNEEYDLDLACNLRSGISTGSHTQEYLKNLVGYELEAYRKARGIKKELDSKHRCWRLEYADDLSFHMDVVPCIPESSVVRDHLFESINESGNKSINETLARDVSLLAVAITDDRLENYNQISLDWLISNPEGYAKWFDSRMRTNQFNDELEIVLEKAQVDDIPLYKRKSILQRVIQLLKRHRDVMFANNTDSKPISVILTTIAAESYSGGSSIESEMQNALIGLKAFADLDEHYLPNPVNPAENFADRWTMHKYAHLQLKENFVAWVNAAIEYFSSIETTTDIDVIQESIREKMSLNTSSDNLRRVVGTSAAATTLVAKEAKALSFRDTEEFIEDKYLVNLRYKLRIDCTVSQQGFVPDSLRSMLQKHMPLLANKKLLFKVVENHVPKNTYHIEWKVLNRGEVAQRRDCIRGQIIPDEGFHQRKETTNFKGEHVVECYAIQNNIVVARDRISVPIQG